MRYLLLLVIGCAANPGNPAEIVPACVLPKITYSAPPELGYDEGIVANVSANCVKYYGVGSCPVHIYKLAPRNWQVVCSEGRTK